ncbi:type III secretion system export apparatus subunit SctU [Aquabacterium sp. OR-4]|uniref:type III secretion system export apparatus subunit SctU n=1 Tax=Aquabacterium sp. OR-4 TaxID=2978127 RepID=UPI0021B49923|nr:type III secretion system export apparatus subunit SctU [Aquabacterium sp. OR-4]MDT7836036.1 type III secretion system export apparatus subunit SctU [Aquabacterium sp. OR-4]
MAGDAQGGAQEKTEQPTHKKLRDARQRGDVWQSRDLSASVAVLVFTVVAVAGARPAVAWLLQLVDTVLTAATAADTDVGALARGLFGLLAWVTVAAAGAGALVGALASGLQVGGVVAFDKVKPDLNHLNPMAGLKRIFAWRTLIELLRLLIKLVAVAVMLWLLARALLPLLARSQHMPLAGWLALGGAQFQALLVLCCVVFGIVALADVAWQRHDYLKRLRMSKDEVIREFKEREGDPILRGRRKQLHHEIAFSDMLQRVRSASVVVVNPTHVAVALHYDRDETPLPMVVAKGEGEVARAIRRAAEEAGVPIYRDIPLARALQADTPLGDYIPDELMQAVAEVLRWVQRMKNQDEGQGQEPYRP